MVLASFGKGSSFLHSYDAANDILNYLDMDTSHIKLGCLDNGLDAGWQIDGDTISAYNITAEILQITKTPYPKITMMNVLAGNQTIIEDDKITMSGDVYDINGNKKTPTILEELFIAASAPSYTFLDSRI